MKTYSFEIANPVYPVTSPTGNILAAGTVATKVVRIRANDFVFDVSYATLRSGDFSPRSLKPIAKECGIDVRTLGNELVAFAQSN